MKQLYLLFVILMVGSTLQAAQLGRPLKTDILDNDGKVIAKALIYIDFVEILDLNAKLLGKVGIVNIAGNFELFVVRENEQYDLVGYAKDRQLFNHQDQLIGHYDWTSYWVYSYNALGQRIGKAKCIAFRGYCAVAVAAFLNGAL